MLKFVMERKTPSAIGERQILPRHTKRTDTGWPDAVDDGERVVEAMVITAR